MSRRSTSCKAARSAKRARNHRTKNSTFGRPLYRRLLRLEPLEDRRLLALVTVTTLEDSVNFNDGVTSLREAIFATNTVEGADTIDFAPELTASGPATVLLTQGELQITDSLEVNGPGADFLTIDASGSDPTPDVNNGDGSRPFTIDDGLFANVLVVSISGLSITGADTSLAQSGGAILSRENLSVADCLIFGNSTDGGGGSIYSAAGSLTVESCVIRDNSARGGGGIAADRGVLTIRGSKIDGNTSILDGGGISAFSPMSLIDSSVRWNTAKQGGGIAGDIVTVVRSEISHNSAAFDGGGIKADRSLTASDSLIQHNSAGNDGGGIRARTAMATNCTIVDNSAIRVGGGIAGDKVTAVVCNVGRNEARGGGGIRGINVTVTDSIVSENTASASAGGGISAHENVTVSSSTIDHNRSMSTAGGIFANHRVFVSNSTISGNRAESNGGGIFAVRGATLANSTISGNSSRSGGGLYTLASVQIDRTTIAYNVAERGGGAFLVAGVLSANGSVVARNSAAIGPDLGGFLGSSMNPSYSLIGNAAGSGLAPTNVGVSDGDGNLIGGPTHVEIDPRLGPLSDNGGPTWTHALLPGSPAINAGDPAATAGASGLPTHDQRGAPFTRVFGGRIDMGAVETIPAGFLPGDYSLDGVVDAVDYSLWRNTKDTFVAPGSGADGNGDGRVDQLDYLVWKRNFGASFDVAQDGTSEEQGARSPGQGVALQVDKEMGRQGLRRAQPNGDKEAFASAAGTVISGLQRSKFNSTARQVRGGEFSTSSGIEERTNSLQRERAVKSWLSRRGELKSGLKHPHPDPLPKGEGEESADSTHAVDAVMEALASITRRVV